MITCMQKKIATTLVAILFFCVAPSAYAGFGVSPAKIMEDNLVPGSHYERTVYLVQGNPEEDISVTLKLESSDGMADWFTFPEGDVQTIPAGVQQFPVKVLIDVPEDIDLGIYRAFLRINTVPDPAKADGQVAISIGGRIDVEVTVGDNIIEEYDIQSIKIRDIYAGERFVTVVKVNNTGNVPIKPAGISFELFNKFGNVRLSYLESEFEETVPSFTVEDLLVTFKPDTKIAPGEYWGHVKVYDSTNRVIREHKNIFNVQEVTLATKIIRALPKVGIVLGVIVVGVLVNMYRKRKRKKRV